MKRTVVGEWVFWRGRTHKKMGKRGKVDRSSIMWGWALTIQFILLSHQHFRDTSTANPSFVHLFLISPLLFITYPNFTPSTLSLSAYTFAYVITIECSTLSLSLNRGWLLRLKKHMQSSSNIYHPLVKARRTCEPWFDIHNSRILARF